jgi:hypothetical protein
MVPATATASLQTLIFGEPPNDRQGAPEFGLLPEVLDVLTEKQFVRAVRIAGQITAPETRTRVIAAFATRLATTDTKRLSLMAIGRVAGSVPDPDLSRFLTAASIAPDPSEASESLRLMAPILPPNLLPRGLQLARQLTDQTYADPVLAALAARFAELGSINEARSVVTEIVTPGWRGQALAAIARYVHGPARDSLTSEAVRELEKARKAGDEWLHDEGLSLLARSLAESGAPERGLTLARRISQEDLLANALESVSRTGQEKTQEEALRRAADLQDHRLTMKVVVGTAEGSSGQRRVDLLRQAVETARLLPDEWSRLDAMGGLVGLLEPPLRERVLEDMVHDARAAGWSRSLVSAVSRGQYTGGTIKHWESGRLPPGLGEEIRRLSESSRKAAKPLLNEFLSTLENRVNPIAEGGGSPYTPPNSIYQVPEASPGETLPGPERVVSTGFSPRHRPHRPIDGSFPLRTGEPYWYWLEVGEPVAGSIEETPEGLPQELSAAARVTVVIFPFEGGLVLRPGAMVGELEVVASGVAVVVKQVTDSDEISGHSRLAARRLFFPVDAPSQEGVARMRCSIYYERTLIQSRLIEVRVENAPRQQDRALRSIVDYRLTRRLDPEHLAGLGEHSVSLMMNDGGDSTHELRIVSGDTEETRLASFSIEDGPLGEEIRQLRGALRRASWGDDGEWTPESEYRYRDSVALDLLFQDLRMLAVNGYRLFHLIARLSASAAGGDVYEEADELRKRLRRPGVVQVALRERPSRLLPAALIYDYDLDTTAVEYELCPDFVISLDSPAPLDETKCFRGECSQASPDAKDTVVCPGGFWGFRHYLGMPVTIGRSGDVPVTIGSPATPEVVMGASTDLADLRAHHNALMTLVPDPSLHYEDTRKGLLDRLTDSQPEIVYLYCHCGLDGIDPSIRIGPTDERGITPDNLFHERVKWADSRSLVFINGCHTTALDPEQAVEFVSFFVGEAWASGVIGTEITVFEELARPFAEGFLERFIVQRLPIGEAIRGARLALLKERNPLGLAYIPFALATLRLTPAR